MFTLARSQYKISVSPQTGDVIDQWLLHLSFYLIGIAKLCGAYTDTPGFADENAKQDASQQLVHVSIVNF